MNSALRCRTAILHRYEQCQTHKHEDQGRSELRDRAVRRFPADRYLCPGVRARSADHPARSKSAGSQERPAHADALRREIETLGGTAVYERLDLADTAAVR